MRTYDFAPLGRYTVGFDHLFDRLNQSASNAAHDNFPPYNILKTGEDSYRVSLAVAGFSPDELSITAEQNLLTITGRRQPDDDDKEFLFRGIAKRNFEQKFNLGEYVEVEGATIDNGMLHVDLVRRIPDAQKPRTIPIGTSNTASVTDQRKAA